MIGESWSQETHESSGHFEAVPTTITICTFAEVPAAGFTDRLLEVDTCVMQCSFSIFCSSLSLAHFAPGPCLIGKPNHFPKGMMDASFTSASGKFLKQTLLPYLTI